MASRALFGRAKALGIAVSRAGSRADAALATSRADADLSASRIAYHADAAFAVYRAGAALAASRSDAALALSRAGQAALALSRADAAALDVSRADAAALDVYRADAAALAVSRAHAAALAVNRAHAAALAVNRAFAVGLILSRADAAALAIAGARGCPAISSISSGRESAPASSPRQLAMGSRLGPSKARLYMQAPKLGFSLLSPRGYSSIPANEPIGPDGLPVAVDWVARGAVTGISQQGTCGSCWAFASTVGTEGINFIFTGSLLKLSEQQLLDCVHLSSNGCNGGSVQASFKYIINNGGQVTYDEYPYVGVQNLVPKKFWSLGVTIDDYESYTNVDEGTLKSFVARQPIVVAVGADQRFHNYQNGIFDGPNYSIGELNQRYLDGLLGHWIAIVAYGEDALGWKFWKCKNSFGEDWGEEGGYIYIARDTGKEGGAFGICRFVYFPVKYSQNKMCLVQTESELRNSGLA